MEHRNFSFTAIVEQQKVVAIVGYWIFNKYVYIEHLAVHPLMRGLQIGSTRKNDDFRNQSPSG